MPDNVDDSMPSNSESDSIEVLDGARGAEMAAVLSERQAEPQPAPPPHAIPSPNRNPLFHAFPPPSSPSGSNKLQCQLNVELNEWAQAHFFVGFSTFEHARSRHIEN
jgi:hypothetical protein